VTGISSGPAGDSREPIAKMPKDTRVVAGVLDMDSIEALETQH